MEFILQRALFFSFVLCFFYFFVFLTGVAKIPLGFSLSETAFSVSLCRFDWNWPCLCIRFWLCGGFCRWNSVWSVRLPPADYSERASWSGTLWLWILVSEGGPPGVCAIRIRVGNIYLFIFYFWCGSLQSFFLWIYVQWKGWRYSGEVCVAVFLDMISILVLLINFGIELCVW